MVGFDGGEESEVERVVFFLEPFSSTRVIQKSKKKGGEYLITRAWGEREKTKKYVLARAGFEVDALSRQVELQRVLNHVRKVDGDEEDVLKGDMIVRFSDAKHKEIGRDQSGKNTRLFPRFDNRAQRTFSSSESEER